MFRLASSRSNGKMNRYQRMYDAGLFFPASQLSGYYADLDADNIYNQADGSVVSTWFDLSGNGHNASQASNTLRPLYKVGGANNRPYVRFDGGDDFLTMGSLAKMANYTIFAVWRTTSASTRQWVYGALDSGGDANNAWGSLDFTAANKFQYYFSTGSANSQGTAGASVMTSNVWAITAHRFTSGQNAEEWWKNGVSLSVTTISTAATANSGTAYGWSIGRPGDLSAVYFGGDMARLVLCNAACSNTQVAAFMATLSAKYAI